MKINYYFKLLLLIIITTFGICYFPLSQAASFIGPAAVAHYLQVNLLNLANPEPSLKRNSLTKLKFKAIHFSTEINGKIQTVAINQPLDVRVQYQSVEQDIKTYSGEQDGRPAVFVITGDHISLISPDMEGVMRVTSFSSGKNSDSAEKKAAKQSIDAKADDEVVKTPQITDQNQNSTTKQMVAMPDYALMLNVAIHDDVSKSSGVIYADYFTWWTKEILEHIPNVQHILINFRRYVPGVTDIDYQDKYGFNLHDIFEPNISAWAHGLPAYQSKFLLLTENPPHTNHDKEHTIGSRYGIANLTNYQKPAKSIGQMIGGDPGDAEIQNNGWPCETIMHDAPHALRGNCYQYSDQNRKNIDAHWHQSILNSGIVQFVIKNVKTGQVLDVFGSPGIEGIKVGMADKHGKLNQKWKLLKKSDDFFSLLSQDAAGLCLAASGTGDDSVLRPCYGEKEYGMDFTFTREKTDPTIVRMKNSSGNYIGVDKDLSRVTLQTPYGDLSSKNVDWLLQEESVPTTPVDGEGGDWHCDWDNWGDEPLNCVWVEHPARRDLN